MFKGVFFDLYGTLLVYGDMRAAWSDWLTAFYERLSECGLSMSKESFAWRCDGFFGRPEPPSRDDGLTVLERRIQALCAELGLDLSSLEIKETAAECVEAWQEHISLDPDARPVLEALRPTKTLALISNFDHPPHVHRLLSNFGLAGFFGAVVVSGAVGVKKPDPRIFSLALQRTGLQPHEVVYVGDATEDVQGACAAGLYPIRIRREGLSGNQMIADFRLNQQPSRSTAVDSAQTISKLPELVEMLL